MVDPADIGLLRATPAPSLTLVTCYPFTYMEGAPQLFVVRALPAGVVSPRVLSKDSPFAAPGPRRRTSAANNVAAAAGAPARDEVAGRPATVAAPAGGAVTPADTVMSETTPAVANGDDAASQTAPKHGLKRLGPRGAFHKLAAVFSHRAKLQ
jgi:hypothetical protein